MRAAGGRSLAGALTSSLTAFIKDATALNTGRGAAKGENVQSPGDF